MTAAAVASVKLDSLESTAPIAAPLPDVLPVEASRKDKEKENESEEEARRKKHLLQQQQQHHHGRGHAYAYGHELPHTKDSGAAVMAMVQNIKPEDFVSQTIGYCMREKYMTRKDACSHALREAQLRNFPTSGETDPGFGYALTLGALEHAEKISLLCGDSHVCRSVGKHKLRSDEELVVEFDTQSLAPLASRVLLAVDCPETKAVQEEFVDFEEHGVFQAAAAAAAGCSSDRLVRVPLIRGKKLKRSYEKQLPQPELQLVVSGNRDTRRVNVHSAELVVYLRPSEVNLLVNKPSAPCYDRRFVCGTPDVLELEFASEEERRQSECIERPKGLSAALEAILHERLGPAHTFRLVAHQNRQHLASAGTASEAQFYRLGHISEILLNIAVIAHIQEHAPKEWSRVDHQNPELTSYFLRKSGATNVLEGLKEAYRYVGDGSIPSPSQLYNHLSGLPSEFAADKDTLRLLMTNTVVTANPHDEFTEDMALQLEKFVGAHLADKTRPIFSPSTKFSYSALNASTLRYFLPDWKTHPHGSEYLLQVCRDVGLTSAHFSYTIKERHAPSAPDVATPRPHHFHDSPLFVDSAGLSCRIDELANFLAAAGTDCKHSWNSAASHAKYRALPHTLLPRTCVSRSLGIYHGFGWDHLGVPCRGFEENGLRVLVRVSHTSAHHTVLVCMVPALSLSFALGTNAPLRVLLGQQRGAADASNDPTTNTPPLIGLLSKILNACVEHLAKMENAYQKRACMFNPLLNKRLAQPPPFGTAYAAHVEYSAHKTPYFVNAHAALHPFVAGGGDTTFVSLSDMRHTAGSVILAQGSMNEPRPELFQSGHTLKLQLKRVKRDAGAGGERVVYTLTESHAFGETAEHVLAWDHAHYRTNLLAAQAFTANKKGAALDKRLSGAFRVVDVTDELLGETVHFEMARFKVAGGALQEEPVVYYRGRVYVRPSLYDLVRRTVAPSTVDRLATMIEPRAARTDAGEDGTTAAAAEGDEDDARVSLSEILRTRSAQSKLPEVAQTGARFGAGLGIGLAGGLVGGALLGSALYPRYYPPYYYPAPYVPYPPPYYPVRPVAYY